ncbi:MAG: Rid family hydrolase [Pirellulaceae bacterium]|jgi:enamine deaminase RidA (YjgF/YER057c/UK114 family)|nr:Rid family hydrolase [Pirellulaceae bacterium]
MTWQSVVPVVRVGLTHGIQAARALGRARRLCRWVARPALAVSVLLAVNLVVLAPATTLAEPPAQDTAASDASAVLPDIQYLPLDAPPGMSQAVVVRGQPLVHTRQLLPLDRDGILVGPNSADEQIQQVLNNLDAVLSSSGSSLNQLVRLHVYAISPATVERVRELLIPRLDATVRPAIAAVLTPLPHRQALVAVDAVAVSSVASETVSLARCETVAGTPGCADAAVLPRGGVAFLSGVPAEGGLAHSAIDRSMATLRKTLDLLQLAPSQIVQLKVFLRPALSADEVRQQLQEFFPNQLLPPVVFVEWIAQAPVEIELIAQLPAANTAGPHVEYFNPPDVRPLPTFSRVALVRSDQQIYVSGLFARKAGRGEEQATDVFEQLQTILSQTGSDMQHLAKATYYVSDDDAGRGFDRVRPRLFDPQRPPAASKVMVYGAGQAARTVTMDMIAVPRE